MTAHDPYQAPIKAVPAAQPALNGLAVAALVLGIVWIGWIGSILAVIFGHVALRQIAERGETGRGLAIAGLVLGYVGIGTFILFFVLPLLSVAWAAGPTSPLL